MTDHSYPAQQYPLRTTHVGENADLPVITADAVEVGRTLIPAPFRTGAVVQPPTTSDLNVIRQAVVDAQRGTPSLDVCVTPQGDVVAAGAANSTARLSTVVGDTFYALDLNAIQRATLAAQQNDGQVAEKDRVFVDQNGDVMLGDEVGDHSRASAVVGDTFYARDLLAESRAVAKMPPSVKVSDGTYEGYSYSITNHFGDTYDLFIYYHPSFEVYRVALVSPRLGGELDVHGGHLYSDGTLCLTRRSGSGYRSMEETYAKSALWTLGASLYRMGYGFQFNIGQDGDSRA